MTSWGEVSILTTCATTVQIVVLVGERLAIVDVMLTFFDIAKLNPAIALQANYVDEIFLLRPNVRMIHIALNQ